MMSQVSKQLLVIECEPLPYLISLQLRAHVLRSIDLQIFVDMTRQGRPLKKRLTRGEEGARVVRDAVA